MRQLNQGIQRTAFATVCGLVLSASVHAAPPIWTPQGDAPVAVAVLQVEELKETYLECDRLASSMLLDPSTAAHCSVVAESLRRVGFDGRSDGVIQWWSGLSSLRVRVPAERAKPVAPLSRGHAASL